MNETNHVIHRFGEIGAPPSECRCARDGWEPGHLRERIGWLITLRWIAVAGVGITIVISFAFGITPNPAPLLVIGALMAGYNAYFLRSHRPSAGAECAEHDCGKVIFRQLVLDLVALTLLLHWSGGAENPFAMFFAYHMALGAMLLPRALGFELGAFASVLYGSVLLGEFVGYLPHHPLRFSTELGADTTSSLYRAPAYVLGVLVAFNLMLFGTLYFVQSVAERHRRAERLRRHHEQVAQARERLARVGEISAGVAHAIRNPLHGLINSIDYLGSLKTADPSAAETLSLMSDALRRIEVVTHRMLVLTREIPPDRRPTDLSDLVHDVLRDVGPEAWGSHVKVVTELSVVGEVEVDGERFGEALANVLTNALDACKGGGTVELRTFRERPGSSRVCIEVADDGPGIAPDQVELVFQPFFTTKAVGEGSGLGLSITRRIVEDHGGRVTLESSPKGTRVRIVVPDHFEATMPQGVTA